MRKKEISGAIDLDEVKQILAIDMGGIGDIILFTPALKALKERLPGVRITLLTGEPLAAEPVMGSGLIDEVIMFDRRKRHGLYEKVRFVMAMRAKRFDLAIVSTGTNAFKGSLFARLAGIPHRVGEDIKGAGVWYTVKTGYDGEASELEGNLNLIKAIGVAPKDTRTCVFIARDDEEIADKILSKADPSDGPIVGMHIGPAAHGKNVRRWPHGRFAELAGRLADSYRARVVLVGGPDEADLANEVARTMKSRPIVTAGGLSVRQTAALIKRCSLFITSDSGPMHIAVAVGTPVVAIFGPTDPKRKYPPSDDFVIVRKGLECSPCYDGKRVACERLDCLMSVTVDEAFEAAARLLRQKKGIGYAD